MVRLELQLIHRLTYSALPPLFYRLFWPIDFQPNCQLSLTTISYGLSTKSTIDSGLFFVYFVIANTLLRIPQLQTSIILLWNKVLITCVMMLILALFLVFTFCTFAPDAYLSRSSQISEQIIPLLLGLQCNSFSIRLESSLDRTYVTRTIYDLLNYILYLELTFNKIKNKFTKNMQHQSAAQKQMLNNNYRLHKQRLTQIRNTNHSKNAINTSFQFYSVNKTKNEDRKKLMMLQQRKQQIQHQNLLLKTKINSIRVRDGKSISFYQDRQGRKQSKDVKNKNRRYNNENQEEQCSENPITINQEDGNQNFRCAIPAPIHGKKRLNHYIPKDKAKKGIYISFNASLATKQRDQSISNQKGYIIQKSASKVDDKSHSQARKSSHELGSINRTSVNVINMVKHDNDQILHPQLALDREIYYKKTTFLSNTTSCLLQISMINKRILFLAYVMGQQNFTAKLYLDQTRSKNLISNCAGDYALLSSKVTVDKVNKTIKVTGMGNPNLEKDGIFGLAMASITQKNRKSVVSKQQSFKIQQEFIKRNYFNREKNNRTADPTQQNQNQPNTANKQQLQSNRRSLVTTSHQNTMNGHKRYQNWQDKHRPSFFDKYKFNYGDKQTQQNTNLNQFSQAVQFKGQSKQFLKTKIEVSSIGNKLSNPNYGKRDKTSKDQKGSQNKFSIINIQSRKKFQNNAIANRQMQNKSKATEFGVKNKSQMTASVKNTSKFSQNSKKANNDGINQSGKQISKSTKRIQQKNVKQDYQDNQDDIIRNVDSNDQQGNYRNDEFENEAKKLESKINSYYGHFDQDFQGQGSPIIVTKKNHQNESNVYSQQFENEVNEKSIKNESSVRNKNVKGNNDRLVDQSYQDDFAQQGIKNTSGMQKKSQVYKNQEYQQEFEKEKDEIKQEQINDQYDDEF